jgi:lipoate-protein ligase A
MIIATIRKKVWDACVLSELRVWHDTEARDGPANMAVDEWLWHHTEVPLLRVYHWSGDWMSIGYFSEAAAVPEGRAFVRRPTGGGLVDHRKDWTYTLIVPRGHPIAEMPGAESYRMVHQALCDVLLAEGKNCRLLVADDNNRSEFCFRQAVRYDLVDESGRKIAGAGQRRGRQALLHQGSVLIEGMSFPYRGLALASHLAQVVSEIELAIDDDAVHRLSNHVYQRISWNLRR